MRVLFGQKASDPGRLSGCWFGAGRRSGPVFSRVSLVFGSGGRKGVSSMRRLNRLFLVALSFTAVAAKGIVRIDENELESAR